MKWIASNGGPLIFLGKRLLNKWHGADPRSMDYERACDVADYLGTIDVDSGQALVLGDEPMQTCWIADSQESGAFVRWSYAANEHDVALLAKSILALNFPGDDRHVFAVDEKVNVLFDSALAGEDVDPLAAEFIELSPGIYEVNSRFFRPDSETELLIHKLQRIPREEARGCLGFASAEKRRSRIHSGGNSDELPTSYQGSTDPLVEPASPA